MIKKEKLFAIMEDRGQSLEDVQKDLREEPYTKIGMFTKLIANHEIFHKKLELFMKKEKSEYDAQNSRSASEFVVYNRAYFYIKQLDLKDENHLEAIVDFKNKPFIDTLNASIDFFQREEIEQYEKCAFLLKVKKIKEKAEDFKKNLEA
jgi:hypothetical protein